MWSGALVQRFAPCATVLQLPERLPCVPDPNEHHAASSSHEQRQVIQFLLVLPSQRALDSGPYKSQYVHPCRPSNGKHYPVTPQSCRVSRGPGIVHRGTKRVDRHRLRHRAPRCEALESHLRVHPANRREHCDGPPLESPWPRGV